MQDNNQKYVDEWQLNLLFDDHSKQNYTNIQHIFPYLFYQLIYIQGPCLRIQNRQLIHLLFCQLIIFLHLLFFPSSFVSLSTLSIVHSSSLLFYFVLYFNNDFLSNYSMIKINPNPIRLLSLTANSHFHKSSFSFCSIKKQYPYKFGGLPVSSFCSLPKQTEFQKRIFSPKIHDTFVDLYRNYLAALQSKDMKFLSEHVQQSLLNEIQNKDVKLINKDSPIQVGVLSNYVIGQIGFARKFHGQEMKKRKSPKGFEQSQQVFQAYSLQTEKDYDLISLFSTKIYFKSSLKLQKKRTSANSSDSNSLSESSPEVHLVQFEVEHKMSRPKLLFRKALLKILYFRNKEKQREEMIRIMLGASPTSLWKIADVDSIGNGNLPKIVSQFTNRIQKK